MKGSTIMMGMLGLAVITGAGMWYSIEVAYYQPVTGVTEVVVDGTALPVSNFEGIDADTSPIKMRACFTVDWDYVASNEYKDIATPLRAPRSFSCFDGKKLTDDLLDGTATAVLAESNIIYGFDRFIARYPDGRAYMWRQINECGQALFDGDPLPRSCPMPDDGQQSSNAAPLFGREDWGMTQNG
jgi:uncharacterized protein DUF6446